LSVRNSKNRGGGLIDINPASLQTNLFDDENYYRNAYRHSLNEFNIEKAIDVLKKWQMTFYPPADIHDKIQALQLFSDSLEYKLDYLANLYSNIYTMDDFASLKNDRHNLKKGISKKIYSLLTPTEIDFINPELHPAEIYINMEDFKAVFSCTKQYFSHFGEHPLIRQFEAYAFYHKGETNSAAISTTYALFDNVTKCNTELLCPGSYAKKYDYLLQSSGNQQQSLLRLPFSLWKDGKTFIIPNDDKFEKYLRRTINKERKIAVRTIEDDIIYFYHLQYLAEMMRLRNVRNGISQELIDIRTEMSKTNREMFNSYIEILSSFSR
jgi:hypothetical protein